MPRLRLALAATAAVLVAPPAAPTADAWLRPARSTVPAGVEAVLALSAAGAAGAEAAVHGRVRLAGRTAPLPAPLPAGADVRFRVPLRHPGIATIAVAVAPRDVALDSAGAEARLRAIGAPDSVRRAFLAGAPRRWRERRAAHAKAFVRVTSPLRPAPAGDSSWAHPVGAPLELVPDRDPTALRAGDTLVARVLRGGRPVYDFPVSLAREGTRGEALARTATWGRVALPLPRAGRWRLRAVALHRPPGAAADAPWASDVATLTVVVR